MPNPYESANEGSGVPHAAANGFGVAVGTGVGAGIAGVVGTVLPPPQAAIPAIIAKAKNRRIMCVILERGRWGVKSFILIRLAELNARSMKLNEMTGSSCRRFGSVRSPRGDDQDLRDLTSAVLPESRRLGRQRDRISAAHHVFLVGQGERDLARQDVGELLAGGGVG